MTNLNKPQTNLELLALFGKARDQELDRAEAEILNELLISDSRIRGLYRGFFAIGSGLEEIAQQEQEMHSPTAENALFLNETDFEILNLKQQPAADPEEQKKNPKSND